MRHRNRLARIAANGKDTRKRVSSRGRILKPFDREIASSVSEIRVIRNRKIGRCRPVKKEAATGGWGAEKEGGRIQRGITLGRIVSSLQREVIIGICGEAGASCRANVWVYIKHKARHAGGAGKAADLHPAHRRFIGKAGELPCNAGRGRVHRADRNCRGAIGACPRLHGAKCHRRTGADRVGRRKREGVIHFVREARLGICGDVGGQVEGKRKSAAGQRVVRYGRAAVGCGRLPIEDHLSWRAYGAQLGVRC